MHAERVRLWLNLAAAALARGHHAAAAGWCDFVLEASPSDTSEATIKALYRRAQAHMHLGSLEMAAAGLRAALAISQRTRRC